MARPKKEVASVAPEVVEVTAEVSSVCSNCEASGLACSECHFDPSTTSVV